MNNFEKIKEMNIEEMAELLSLKCEYYEFVGDCSDSLCGDENCINHLKQWLESESEE